MANKVVEENAGNYSQGDGGKEPLKNGHFDGPYTVGQVELQSYKLVSM